MKLPQYVYWRGNSLVYRRGYPKELWPVTGVGRSFSVALKTSDPKEAARARPEAERRYHAKVDAARAALARRTSLPPLTRADAEALAVRWFLDALENLELARVNSPECVQVNAERARERAAEARRQLAEGELVWAKARRLRDEAGFDSNFEAERHLVRLLGRASVAAEEVEAGRAVGRYETRPGDPLFASAMEAPRPVIGSPQLAPPTPSAEPQGRTIADLEKAYRAARFPNISEASRLAYEPVFRLLNEILGPDAPLAGLGYEQGETLFETVQRIPVNSRKLEPVRGLGLLEAIAEGERLGLPTLAPNTINGSYLTKLGALFRFAVRRGWMNSNPVERLRVREEVAAAEAREPFGKQLPKLFAASPWTPRDTEAGGKPIHYWGPLLALYQGLRLGEVAGLLIGDVDGEGGQPMIHVRPGKRALKTDSARRDLPVHPELVRLGFLHFVSQRREKAKPDALLFAGEKVYARGQWGRSLGRWFARRVRAEGLQGRKLTFHSFRHDFRDALREGEVEQGLADYLMGHAREGMGAVYGAARPSLARLKAAIAKVGYSGLHLPGPTSGTLKES